MPSIQIASLPKRVALCAALLFGLVARVSPAAETVWDPELGWVDMSAGPGETAKGLYAHAAGLYVKGDYSASESTLRRLVKRFPSSPLVPKATFRRAECLVRLEKAEKAIRVADGLLADTPKGIDREEIIALQLRAAKVLSKTHSRRSLFAFEKIAAAATTKAHQFAAHMGRADTHRRREEYAAAADSYKKAFAAAPDAGSGNDALFAAALDDLRACREQRGDDARLKESLANFRAFRLRAPRDPRAELASEMASAAAGVLSEKNPRKRLVHYGLTWLAEGKIRKAEKVFKRGAKRFAGTELGGVAHYRRGECLFLRGKHRGAFAVLQAFAKAYPESVDLRKAVKHMFEIGESARERGKRTFAVSVFEGVADADPNGPLADDAFMYVGECRLAARQYVEAKAAFDAVVREYPRSEWAYAALFKGGLSDLKASDYSEDNEGLLMEARRAFELYLHRQPAGPFAKQSETLLSDCLDKQARNMAAIARYYERQEQFISSAWYHRAVAQEHPNTPSAATSREILKTYRSQGLRLP